MSGEALVAFLEGADPMPGRFRGVAIGVATVDMFQVVWHQ